ncbi:MAG: Mu transposase C-terminal domain-containing protein [Bryobacterales bacterium]|nr:Mu transposase C-terminal domain-containing protein [Bryobacterales bacterium]
MSRAQPLSDRPRRVQSKVYSKGKIERFFRTVRQQFLAPLPPEDLTSLDAINRKLRVWIEGEYHRTPHRGLGDGHTPLERWAQRADRVRPLPPGIDLPRLCLPRHQRRVSKDRVVHLHGRQYEVEARLAGRRVTVIEDPDAPPARPLEVECDGEPAGRAVLLNPYANARRRARKRRPERQPREQAASRGPPPPPPPPPRPPPSPPPPPPPQACRCAS